MTNVVTSVRSARQLVLLSLFRAFYVTLSRVAGDLLFPLPCLR